MEGPSLFLAQEQLHPFIGQTVIAVDGNTKIGKERLLNQPIIEVFAWGKHLVLQFPDFALRTHFLLFGTFTATLEGKSITGDYRKARVPRLALTFANGQIELFNCSIKFFETSNLKATYDYTVDIMSEQWDSQAALKRIKLQPDQEIADVLLDQTVFAGVGNIIKNEVLWLCKIHPQTKVVDLSDTALKKLIEETQTFSHHFYEWRKVFLLKAHLQIYRKKICPRTNTPVTRLKTGLKQRWSFFCPVCQTNLTLTSTPAIYGSDGSIQLK